MQESEQDLHFFVASVANQIGDYETSVTNVRKAIAINRELTIDQQLIVSQVFKAAINQHRTPLRGLESKIDHEASRENIERVAQLTAFQAKLVHEMKLICETMITSIDTKLLPAARSNLSKLQYHAMKADAWRYMAECPTEDHVIDLVKADAVEQSKRSYDAALKILEEDETVPREHPFCLALKLHYSILLCKQLGRKEDAIRITREAYETNREAVEQMKGDDSIYSGAMTMLRLLKDHAEIWSNDDMTFE